MARNSSAASTVDEIAAIQELMSDLEKRLGRLSGATKREFSGASGEINDYVSDAIAGIMSRIREGAHSVSQPVADKALHLGDDAFKKVIGKVEQNLLATLAIATGIGFLVGMCRR
jgi:ElaB/YqjD/DUF883 family membrane-anchored ribosome-binding protein